jgi:thioredoxin reductase (NADPH)
MSENNPNFDVIVIGGGPAGLSAALWCEELGLHALLLEKDEEFGGQLTRVYNPIENHLGSEAANGEEMRARFIHQVDKRTFPRRLRAGVSAIDAKTMRVRLESGESVEAGAVIIATGVRRRRLGIEGETEFMGKGVIESGKKDSKLVKGKRALIAGGGDAAIENALILSDVAEKVFVVHRRAEFTAREEFLERAKAAANIEFLTGRTLRKISGVGKVQRVELVNTAADDTEVLPVEIVLVRVGTEPNTEIFRGVVGLDARGYITVNEKCGTTATGVFAAGDAANPLAPTVSSAVGMGATAARAVYDYLLQTRDLSR